MPVIIPDEVKTRMLEVFSGSAVVPKLALYTAIPGGAASVEAVRAYSATNEFPTANGYTAGGETVQHGSPTPSDGLDAQITSSHIAYLLHNPVEWTNLTLSNIRYGLYYDSADAGNRALMVLDFGTNRSVTGDTFTVDPGDDAATSILTLA